MLSTILFHCERASQLIVSISDLMGRQKRFLQSRLS
jgi:hypothetical protein